MAEPIDTLIVARWVVPVEPDTRPREHCAVAVRQGRIVDVLPAGEAASRYAAEEVIERPTHVLIPGFVNAHTHSPMVLLRGMADDLPLMTWLEEHIWPAERRWVSPEFVEDGARLAVAEMLKSGTSCFNDMFFFPEVVARVAASVGIRACVGMIALEFPSPYANDAAEYLDKGLRLHDEYKGHPLVRTFFSPHAPYTCSDETLTRVRTLANELDVPVNIHLHETSGEIEGSIDQHGVRPLARLEKLGLVSPLLVGIHMTDVTDEEMAAGGTAGMSVVHCPESNLKLASGFCPVARLQEAGIEVALGTDGAASNNDLDMLGEMRTAALLAKAVTGAADTLDAGSALRMATQAGANVVGRGDEIGSIVPGKWADLCCVDLDHVSTSPVYDPVSQLVYAATRDQVSDVWVAGKPMVADGRLTVLDETALIGRAEDWARRIGAANGERT